MYISRLSLYGFKSFPRKSEIIFGKGITTIVGPNGCGKTNIVDAIRWVIGEQKASILRADRNSDVIFNGTALRRPLNLAEVSLTIHNVTGRISLPYADIVISRRVYRNGESEYFINNNLCRLKDITDLFIDTGMGANAYSIIELKMIEDILSENPEERKRLFEEAAGVNKYRMQRKAAIRKLEATKEDLVRLNDIISEVESKVKNLRRQLRRFEQYQEITQKLIEAEVQLASCKIADVRTNLQPIESNLELNREKLDKIILDLTKQEEIWKSKQQQIEEQETILNARNNELAEIREQRNKYQTEELVLKEQLRNVQQTITRLQKDIGSCDQTITENWQEEIHLQEQRAGLERSLTEKRESFRVLESKSSEIEQQFNKINSAIQVLQEERFGLLKQQAEYIAGFGNLQDNLQQRQNELNSIEKQLAEHQDNEHNSETKVIQIRQNLTSLKKELDDFRNNLANIENQHTELDKIQQSQQDQCRQVESHLDRLDNQIQFYSGIIQSHEGFDPGLQYILDHPDQFQGIRGALSDLVSVEPKYYLAVEAVLKDISRLLVADNRRAALATLASLAEKGKGRVSIIPLDSDFSVTEPTHINKDNLKPITDFIRCDPAMSRLRDFLFQDVYCCPDDRFDTLIEDEDFQDISLVSDRGRFRDASGIFSGGSVTSESNVLVGRSEKLERLQEEAKSISQELDILKTKLAETDKQISQGLDNKKENVLLIQDKERELQTLQSRLQQYESQLLEVKSIQKTLLENRISLNVLIENFKERLTQADPGKSSLDQSINQLEEKIAIQKESANKTKFEFDRLNSERQNQRIELITLENKYRNVTDALEINNKSTKRAVENKAVFQAELQTAANKAIEIQQTIEVNRQKLAEFQQQVAEAEKSIAAFQDSFQELRNKIQVLNDQLNQLRQSKEILNNSINQQELEKSKYQAVINEVRSILLEKYNRTIPADLPPDLPALPDARQAVERYKRNLEQIGMVNMAVKEEYEEENSRFTFLTEQREDLLKSEKGLNEVILQIDNIAREQYIEVIEQIKHNFKSTFAIFFGGGEADLRLIGDSDPLEAQIDIWACPSGKKMRSLKMLSAGEKALTAIALLFGIYQVKPSPFCILDEVDAPLDDENTRRFNNVIKTYSEKTQFIIVTHNKSTMNIADTMYGITMAENGISQIVSVKME
jgi:chromosome segregation protein